MSRFRVWVEDSKGIHTPSLPLGSRRAAEVFAANRSRFRKDCFIRVCEYGSKDKPITVYRNGRLRASLYKDSFDPEPVIVQVSIDSTVYALAQARIP